MLPRAHTLLATSAPRQSESATLLCLEERSRGLNTSGEVLAHEKWVTPVSGNGPFPPLTHSPLEVLNTSLSCVGQGTTQFLSSLPAISRILRRRLMLVLAVTAAAVDRDHAPPAIFLLVDLHFQMPTAILLTHSLPEKGETYLALWVTSNFLTTFLREAPNLVPNLPTMPTFFVLFAIMYLIFNNNTPTHSRVSFTHIHHFLKIQSQINYLATLAYVLNLAPLHSDLPISNMTPITVLNHTVHVLFALQIHKSESSRQAGPIPDDLRFVNWCKFVNKLLQFLFTRIIRHIH